MKRNRRWKKPSAGIWGQILVAQKGIWKIDTDYYHLPSIDRREPERRRAANDDDKTAYQVIGIHLPPMNHNFLKPDFHNAPPLIFSSANNPQPAPTNPCQYYIEKP